jgi:hypothetical protein
MTTQNRACLESRAPDAPRDINGGAGQDDDPCVCHGCSLTSCPGFGADSNSRAELRGKALVGLAVACFLTPVLCALVAAVCLQTAPGERNAAVLAGLIAGLVLTAGASRVAQARAAHKETTHG